jgi:CheY-like chemotaxis protein
MEAIFDDFYQVRQEHGDRREGLGLGLSIVRRLGQLLGHPVEVRSEPGRGSCFSIQVPRGEPGRAQDAGTRSKPAAGHRSARVLLVDDQPSVARATRMLLELEGHEVHLAASVAEVRQLAQDAASVPDVIVSDYHLSRETTGLDAVSALREITQRPIPAILVTGDTSSAVALASGKVPHCHVLSKPVDADELLERIQQFLRT